MKKLLAAAMLAALPVLAHAAPVAEPASLSDNRIKEVLYSDDDVYTITAKYGYQTNVVFGLGEEIQTISVGDRSMWQIIPSGNRLFIRPMEDNVITNMTVLTDRHSYQFDLHSVGPHDNNNVYVIRFIYASPHPRITEHVAPVAIHAAPPPPPPPPPPGMRPPSPPPLPPQPPEHVPAYAIRHYTPPPPPPSVPGKPASPVNMNYTYSGSDALAPLQVYDNGTATFMRYRDGQPLPGIYALDKDGNRHAVSYTVEGNTMVIHAVAPEWLLENSSGNVQVYNEAIGKK